MSDRIIFPSQTYDQWKATEPKPDREAEALYGDLLRCANGHARPPYCDTDCPVCGSKWVRP